MHWLCTVLFHTQLGITFQLKAIKNPYHWALFQFALLKVIHISLTTKMSIFALLVTATSTCSSRCSSVPPRVAGYKTSDYNCGGSRWSAGSAYNYISNSWVPALDFNWWSSTTSSQSHGVRSSDRVQLWCVSVWENDQEWYTVFKTLFTAQNATGNCYDVGSHLR